MLECGTIQTAQETLCLYNNSAVECLNAFRKTNCLSPWLVLASNIVQPHKPGARPLGLRVVKFQHQTQPIRSQLNADKRISNTP